MTPADALAYLTAAAKAERVTITPTSIMRMLYLTDLRAARYESPLTGLVWERAAHGPYCRTVSYIAKNVEVDFGKAPAWYGHAQAVVTAFGRLSNTEMGLVCKASSPVRKAPKIGDVLDLTVKSTNDPTAKATYPNVESPTG